MPDRRIAVAAAGLLALLLATAVPGLAFRPEVVELAFADGAPAARVDGFHSPAGTTIVGYEHHGYTTLSVTLANRGLVPVEVTDVALVSQDLPLVVEVGGPARISLGAGAQATTDLQVRFDNCRHYHEREVMVVESAWVTARVLGRTVVREVPLDRPLVARSPMLWQCPDRTIVRDDDRRAPGLRGDRADDR